MNTMSGNSFETRFRAALDARELPASAEHKGALRLYNGFTEGDPILSADLYSRTLILHNYSKKPEVALPQMEAAEKIVQEKLPWLGAVVHKSRFASSARERNGVVRFGQPDSSIVEDGVFHAVDLCLNQDASFYLDTSYLRRWLRTTQAGHSVLNAFAYTCSLGTAARAGGAERVVNVDLNRSFLNIGRRSLDLNGFPPGPGEFLPLDFWTVIHRFKHSGNTFDCIILDPPFFTKTRKGSLDLNKDTPRLINKVRPLVRSGGYLVVVNNALFLPGADLLEAIHTLLDERYLVFETIIPVPDDMTGYPQTALHPPPVDPAPFNHPTKIFILKVLHKNPTEG